jgi:hypothetical protein
MDGMFYANRYREGLVNAKAAMATQSPVQGMASYLDGMLLLGLERYDDAIRAFERSRTMGYQGAGFLYASAFAARRDRAGAARALAQRKPRATPLADLELQQYRMLDAIDRGAWAEARESVHDGLIGSRDAGAAIVQAEWRNNALAVDVLAAGPAADGLEAKVRDEIGALHAQRESLDEAYPGISRYLLLGAGYAAARADFASGVAEVLDSVTPQQVAGYPMLREMRQVLESESLRFRGKPDEAMALLAPLLRDDHASIPVHAAALAAARDAGAWPAALAQAEWLAAHRGRAYVEQGVDYLPTPYNIFDTTTAYLYATEALAMTGKDEKARSTLATFARLLPDTAQPPWLRARVARTARALLRP